MLPDFQTGDPVPFTLHGPLGEQTKTHTAPALLIYKVGDVSLLSAFHKVTQPVWETGEIIVNVASEDKRALEKSQANSELNCHL